MFLMMFGNEVLGFGEGGYIFFPEYLVFPLMLNENISVAYVPRMFSRYVLLLFKIAICKVASTSLLHWCLAQIVHWFDRITLNARSSEYMLKNEACRTNSLTLHTALRARARVSCARACTCFVSVTFCRMFSLLPIGLLVFYTNAFNVILSNQCTICARHQCNSEVRHYKTYSDFITSVTMRHILLSSIAERGIRGNTFPLIHLLV